MTVEFDRSGSVEATDIPACGRQMLGSSEAATVRAQCHDSIVGSGVAHVEIQPSETGPIRLPLTLFNGGIRGGKTILFIWSSITQPARSALVARVQLTKIHKGPFGMEAMTAIPQLAAGQGSLVDFNFTIRRALTLRKTARHFAQTKCPDGHLQVAVRSVFRDGSTLDGAVIQPCTAAS